MLTLQLKRQQREKVGLGKKTYSRQLDPSQPEMPEGGGGGGGGGDWEEHIPSLLSQTVELW